MSFFSDLASSINLGANWLLVLLFLGIGFGLGMVLGKNRLNLIILAGYLSFAVTKFIPWKTFLGADASPDANVQIFIFLAIILTIFFFAPYSGFSSVVRLGGRGRGSFWQLGILGMLETGFLISVVISFLPSKTLIDLSPALKQFFLDPLAQFIWLLLPILAIFMLKRKRAYSYSDEE